MNSRREASRKRTSGRGSMAAEKLDYVKKALKRNEICTNEEMWRSVLPVNLTGLIARVETFSLGSLMRRVNSGGGWAVSTPSYVQTLGRSSLPWPILSEHFITLTAARILMHVLFSCREGARKISETTKRWAEHHFKKVTRGSSGARVEFMF